MNKYTTIVVAALVAAPALAQDVGADFAIRAETGASMLSTTWLPAGPGDLTPDGLIADPSRVPDSVHAESEPVRFAWALQDSGKAPPAARVQSRQYWVDANGAELERGIELPLTARGAVIRVSSLERGGDVRLDADRMQLALDGKSLDDHASVMRMITDGEALQKQGMSVPPQTLAFKLDRAVPPGTLRLSVDRLPAEQPLVVHVFEPESEWVAELSLPRHDFYAGEPLVFAFGLGDGERRVRVASVQAVLADPFAERTWDLTVDRDSGRLTRTAPADRFVSGRAGLYEAYVYLETEVGGLRVRRDLKLPLSIVPPVARLTGDASAELGPDGLALDVGVATAAPGRYQVNGRIWGTAADGTLKPLAMTQAAATVEAGIGRVRLEVDAGLLAASGLRAPFEVRGLELLDQGRMYLLQRQHRALVLAP